MVGKYSRLKLVFLVLLVSAGAAPSVAFAVLGLCSNCHTMHYSQGGTVLANWNGPNPMLLTNDCKGCHTGTNDGTTPYVHSAGPPTTSLAGGSFYWVRQADYGDAYGHNVADLSILPETTLATRNTPPGFGTGRAAPDGTLPGTSWDVNQLSCAGTYGCHGTHGEADAYRALGGAHHQNAAGSLQPDSGDPPGAGYRFLQGVKGYEDSNWEYSVSASDHNQYYGVDGGGDNQTISAFCARCHGDYHGSAGTQGGGAWIRHPTDYDLGNTSPSSEYRGYGDDVSDLLITPLASADVSAPLSAVTFSDDTIVTCLSCHRAHGSQYYKMMRWDYAGSPLGGACANCHTTKD